MTPRRRPWHGSPPPWWPAGEPWPPASARALRQARRARFMRRSGWWSFLPVWVLVWIVAASLFRRGHPWSGSGPPFVHPIPLLLVSALLAAGVAFVIRRLSAPVADLVSAADRIAQRDFRVRVDVPRHGPAWLGDTARAFNAMAKELEVQDAARRQTMADIAHELRTPLAVLQGKIEGLIDGVYPRDDARLQTLLDDTRVLARLVDDLRTLATAESGSLALAKEPTDLTALAHDVANSFDARARAAGVTLVVEPPAGSEIEVIAADPVRIREVFVNLLANALRYTPAGGTIRITLGASSTSVDVRVIDTGTGIEPDELPHVFDRFHKGAGSSGSGLGLTIARRLVEAHGGTIRAESIPGRGTTMTFTLPR